MLLLIFNINNYFELNNKNADFLKKWPKNVYFKKIGKKC